MGRRCNIERLLPDDKRKALDEKLYCNGFSEYQQLSDWLKESGYDISRSAVHRYGQRLQRLAITPTEQELLDIFRQLKANDRHTLKRQAQMLLKIANNEKNAV